MKKQQWEPRNERREVKIGGPKGKNGKGDGTRARPAGEKIKLTNVVTGK